MATDVTSLIYFSSTGSDPDDPYNLIGFEAGDNIASGILPQSIRDVATTTSALSSVWQAGGDATVPAGVSGPWQNTFENVRDTSGDRDNAINNLEAASGDRDNTINYVTLDGSNAIASLSAVVGSTASGTALLTGDTPTLSNNLDANSKNITNINNLNTTNLGATNLSLNLNTGEKIVSGTGTYRANNLSGTEVTALTLHATDLGRNIDTQGYDLTGTGTYRATNVTATNLNATNLAANLDAGTNDITNIGTLAATDLLVTNGVTGTASGYGVVNIAGALSSVAMSGYGDSDDLDAVTVPLDQYTPMFNAVAGRMVFRKPVITYGPSIDYDNPMTSSYSFIMQPAESGGGGVDLHLSGGLVVSGGTSSMDSTHNSLSMVRQPNKAYQNLIRATAGTITLEADAVQITPSALTVSAFPMPGAFSNIQTTDESGP